jgi:hypothetical protein
MLTALSVAACDNTLEPIDPGGLPFSVFGYLDASADTQWIRVTPLRTVLRGSADPTGVTVTLEELTSGRIIALWDSAMRYPDVLGSDSLCAHNDQLPGCGGAKITRQDAEMVGSDAPWPQGQD